MNIRLYGILICTLVAGCNGSGNSSSSSDKASADEQLKSLITQRGLTADPMAGKSLPSIQDPIAVLGKRLFFSKSLSGNRDTACVSCHHPLLGGGDQLSLPVGVDALEPNLIGIGRRHKEGSEEFDGGPTVPRNAPTTFNMAGWNTFLFHDGRIEQFADGSMRTPDSAFGQSDPLAGNNKVHAQARFPVTSKEEMKGFEHEDKDNQQIREFLAERLGGYGAENELPFPEYWLAHFRDAFKQAGATAEELINEQNISFAIGEYQRSQIFTNNPWRRYVQGDSSALSDSAKRGALLFFNDSKKGGVNCASCHSGDFFTDEGFHNIAMPQFGRGKGDADGSADFGRSRETGEDIDKFAFRTPSLLNVETTGPWGHSGAYTTLEAVVRHHLKPQSSVFNYDTSQLSQTGIQNLDKLQSNTQEALNHSNFALSSYKISDDQVTDLLNFLKALTDPCTKDASCLAPWILDATDDPDPNGDQIMPVLGFPQQ